MFISDISVKRPVFATVLSLLLVAFGIISFNSLPLRELPNTDMPVVSISTTYLGASAEVIETRITQLIEDQIAGIDGIDYIRSNSRDGRSQVSLVFEPDRDIDDAASDVRDAVARVASRIPTEADSPRVSKIDSDAQAIMWFNLASETMSQMEMADYAERFIVDRLSVIDGVAQVQVGGFERFAMKIWLDRVALAARDMTVADVEQALRRQNVELPAGSIESESRELTIRIPRVYSAEEDFRKLVIGEGPDGHLVRLSEVAKVELAPRERRRMFRGNGDSQIGLGIVKQSNANTLETADAVRAVVADIDSNLPEGTTLSVNFDSTVFIKESVSEVYRTLAIATVLVVLVIYSFLGSFRAAIIPAIVVPVCLTAAFTILALLGYSINIMTLLALVLCIGLVVDDSIVVLENVQRRTDMGEPPLIAAVRGTRQVAFAVIATTMVLIAVFMPLVFIEGVVGRIFGELAATISAAVAISSFVALTLSPMMCSKLLRPRAGLDKRPSFITKFFGGFPKGYAVLLRAALPYSWLMAFILVGMVGTVVYLWNVIPDELAPAEDRGTIFISTRAPQGASFEYMAAQMDKVEQIVLRYRESGEAHRVLVRIPGGWGANNAYNTGMAMVVLSDWRTRERSGHEIMGELMREVAEIPGIIAFAYMNQPFRGGRGAPIQFVLQGNDYDELAVWAETVMSRARQNPGMMRIDSDYEPNKPQLRVIPNINRAADLGVSIQTIGQTLETMLGSRRVTTFIFEDEEYDVQIQSREEDRREPNDLTNIFVRSDRTGKLIPLTNLVKVEEEAAASQRNRFNRLRAITVSAYVAPGYSIGEGLQFMKDVVREEIGSEPAIDYKGESRRFMEQGNAMLFTFGLALLFVFLVLAGQFESFIHPFIIMLTVPVAIAGGLFGLFLVGSSVNLYSQIGMIILIGLAAKNGILIVEFANQLRDEGLEFRDALLKSAETRFRPILMTGVSTAAGSIPLIMASGAGSQSRLTIGVVIFSGVLLSTLMTLFLVPVFYNLLARYTGSPGRLAKSLAEYEAKEAADLPRPVPAPAE